MKTFKTALHFLITLASLVGFLSGWMILSHSRKPIQPISAQVLEPLPPLQPIQSFNNGSNGLQFTVPLSQPRNFSSAFMTGGS
jgi:hypothetical protein